MSRPGTVLGHSMPAVDDLPAPAVTVVLCDLDDFEAGRRSHGEDWARRQLARAEEIVASLVDGRADARRWFVPPDSWLVAIGGDDPAAVHRAGVALARRWHRLIGQRTDLTTAVGVSGAHAGPGRLEQAMAEAARAIDAKLVDGGDRVRRHDQLPVADPSRQPPERVEDDLGRCVRRGDADGAVAALAAWIDRMSVVDGVTPGLLRHWIGAELLYAMDVSGRRRLPDGSADWIESFGRLALDELLDMFVIHERSYLLLWLRRLFTRIVAERAAPSPGRQVLSVVEEHIKAHYAEDLRLATVAEAVYLSPHYISHLFQRELGTTFLQYRTSVRMGHARQLLSSTELPIEAVSCRVGYYSPKRFRDVFKRTFSVTPTEYRQRYGPR
ncbi:helix-turn-helix transcriptional regulator [Jiangella anatolica]|uniref:HTH araC/xylS-type domain-containing protein n=1 Tax=Jiangella anatolica TaxID=2670374 RepID=A0A2W2B4Z3_9ACTN|nr:AraC family transcriptional regulator [Jiangella anatolica]PZF81092.1 hypothetical protein C1I92_22575 [Jiangella anatolica]